MLPIYCSDAMGKIPKFPKLCRNFLKPTAIETCSTMASAVHSDDSDEDNDLSTIGTTSTQSSTPVATTSLSKRRRSSQSNVDWLKDEIKHTDNNYAVGHVTSHDHWGSTFWICCGESVGGDDSRAAQPGQGSNTAGAARCCISTGYEYCST